MASATAFILKCLGCPRSLQHQELSRPPARRIVRPCDLSFGAHLTLLLLLLKLSEAVFYLWSGRCPFRVNSSTHFFCLVSLTLSLALSNERHEEMSAESLFDAGGGKHGSTQRMRQSAPRSDGGARITGKSAAAVLRVVCDNTRGKWGVCQTNRARGLRPGRIYCVFPRGCMMNSKPSTPPRYCCTKPISCSRRHISFFSAAKGRLRGDNYFDMRGTTST